MGPGETSGDVRQTKHGEPKRIEGPPVSQRGGERNLSSFPSSGAPRRRAQRHSTANANVLFLFLTRSQASARISRAGSLRLVARNQEKRWGCSMAQMPRGEPRSVPDPAGELYDESLRQQRLKRQRAEAGKAQVPRFSLDTTPFSQFARELDFRPRSGSTVTIGGQIYREIDNGRANVLVPIDDPLVSQAQRAERRRAIERAVFMAENPLGSVFYGVATLAGASPRARDGALIAGGMADAATLGAARRGAPVRGSPTPPRRVPAPPVVGRPSIRLRELNSDGQAPGVTSTVTRDLLGTGTKPDRRLTPPGWRGHGTRYNEARGHLQANQLGGRGDDMRNLATLTQNRTNSSHMRTFENAVARRARAGEVVEYSVTPLYDPGVLPPSLILMTAHGSRGAPSARLIQNPAGRRK